MTTEVLDAVRALLDTERVLTAAVERVDRNGRGLGHAEEHDVAFGGAEFNRQIRAEQHGCPGRRLRVDRAGLAAIGPPMTTQYTGSPLRKFASFAWPVNVLNRSAALPELKPDCPPSP